jgi:DNA-binding response OmpR family regulator
MTLALVTDDPAVEAAVRLSAPATDFLTFPMAGVTDARGLLGEGGRRIVEAAASAEAVVVQFDFDRAPVLNTLGFHLRRRLSVPLVALCLGGLEERVAALAAGADDAVGLPLHLPRVQARALAHSRLVEAARQQGAERPAAPVAPDVVALGPLRLDRAARRFTIRGESVALTPREFALLDYLLANAGSVRSRSEILDAVWGLSFDTGTNMVDVYVYFLRRKLEAFGVRDLIQTVRGRGYRLVAPDAEPGSPEDTSPEAPEVAGAEEGG